MECSLPPDHRKHISSRHGPCLPYGARAYQKLSTPPWTLSRNGFQLSRIRDGLGLMTAACTLFQPQLRFRSSANPPTLPQRLPFSEGRHDIVTERLSKLIAEWDQWIQTRGAKDLDGPPYAVIERLVSLDRGEWLQLAEHFSRGMRFGITQTLIDRAHALLSRSPKYAVHFAHAAVLFARVIIVPSEPESGDSDRALEVEAHAWREDAHALLTLGQFEEARPSANEAWLLASLDLASADDDSLLGLLLHGVGTGRASEEQLEFAATLALIMGQILRGVRQSDDG